MPLQIPHSLKEEHEELHAELARAAKAGGRTGEAALSLVRIMRPHFKKEEEYALPPLGLLVELSRGEVEPAASEVLKMTDKLEAELPKMLGEHEQIVTALNALTDAAQNEGKPEFAHFAEKLKAHARMEEEVSYPTALLIGRFIKEKLLACSAPGA